MRQCRTLEAARFAVCIDLAPSGAGAQRERVLKCLREAQLPAFVFRFACAAAVASESDALADAVESTSPRLSPSAR